MKITTRMKVIAILFFLSGIIHSQCSVAKGKITPGSEFWSDSLPGHILIINSFDAMSIKARKNKKELFAELADSLKQLVYHRIDTQYQPQVIIYNNIFNAGTDITTEIYIVPV